MVFRPPFSERLVAGLALEAAAKRMNFFTRKLFAASHAVILHLSAGGCQ